MQEAIRVADLGGLASLAAFLPLRAGSRDPGPAAQPRQVLQLLPETGEDCMELVRLAVYVALGCRIAHLVPRASTCATLLATCNRPEQICLSYLYP